LASDRERGPNVDVIWGTAERFRARVKPIPAAPAYSFQLADHHGERHRGRAIRRTPFAGARQALAPYAALCAAVGARSENARKPEALRFQHGLPLRAASSHSSPWHQTAARP